MTFMEILIYIVNENCRFENSHLSWCLTKCLPGVLSFPTKIDSEIAEVRFSLGMKGKIDLVYYLQT